MNKKRPEEDRDVFIKCLDDSFDITCHFDMREIVKALVLEDQEKLQAMKLKLTELESKRKKFLDDYDKSSDIEAKKNVIGSVKP